MSSLEYSHCGLYCLCVGLNLILLRIFVFEKNVITNTFFRMP